MKETLFYYLQAGEINEASKRLLDYGITGVWAFVVTAAFIYGLVFIRKKYERHLTEKDQRREYELGEKDKIIEKLEKKMDQCEKRITSLEDNTIKRLNDSLDHNSEIIALSSIAINDSARVMHETKGVLISNGEKLMEILKRVLDQQK
jgi:uncharacterized protein YlxW (UPF0749 family)